MRALRSTLPSFVRPLVALLFAFLIAVGRYGLRGTVPDDYDAIGFTRALEDFDLARFQPQFPGYPVYVATGRLAHLILPSAFDAASFAAKRLA